MSDITFSMSADEKDVVRALQATGKATGSLREQINELAAASQKAGAADTQMSQQRFAALAPILAKQKELKVATEALQKQLKDGKITADEYKTAFEGIAKESNGLTTELRQLQAAVNEDTADLKKAGTIIGQTEDKTAKYAKAVAELDRLKTKGILTSKQHAQAVAAESAKLNDVGEAAGKSGGFIEGLTGKMAGFVAGLGSASSVIAIIKSEYDALIERQGKSADANISLAAEQEALLLNLGGADAKQTTDQIRDLSKSSGVKEENITRAVNEAMAARGDMEVSSVIDAVGAASKVRKFAPSELAGLAGATIDTQKQTGLGTNESLGFLMQMQAQSRVKSLKGVGENLTPAVGGIMNFGADRETSAAILASLSHGMSDTTGAQTGTSGIQLAKQLREFGGGQDIGKTISMLQQDPAARQKFLEGSSFEAKALPAVESLLSGGTQAKQYAAAKTAMQGNPLDTLNAAISNRDLPALKLAAQDQALANVTDQQRLGDTAGAESGIARRRLAEMRKQSGRWGVATDAQGFAEDVMSGGKMDMRSAIKGMESDVEMLKSGSSDTTRAMRGNVGALGLFSNLGGASIIESRNRNAPETQEMVKQLEELIALTKQQLAAQEAGNANNQQKAHAGIVGNRAADREGS
jgi:hypothetical protein